MKGVYTMSIIADCVEAGIKTVPDFIRWGREMFESKKEKQEAEAGGPPRSKPNQPDPSQELTPAEREALVRAGVDRVLQMRCTEAMNELEMIKRLAQRDFLGATEAELIGESEIPADDVRIALASLCQVGKAFYQNAKWFSRDPVVPVARW
jgi:hypothetical protein